MYALSYAEPCQPVMLGMFGLGAALTPAQRKEKQAAAKAAALAKRTQHRAVVAAKKAARVAGRTVRTSNPAAAEKLNRAVQAAQSQLRTVTGLATRARQTRNQVDVQKALTAAQSAAKFISALNSPVTPPVAAGVNRLRGLGYMGTCVDDGTGSGSMIDDQTQQPCDPATGLPFGGDPSGGGYQPPYTPAPSPYPQPGVYPGTTSPYGVSPTGLVPGFGTGFPSFGGSFGAGYAPLRACNSGSNLPRCIIYQMAVDEQQQFQFVFSILQQMYAQLLQIVQQLLAQLQSAQQAPYGYGQTSPYGQSPYGPYSDPNNPLYSSQYPGYGGQYPGPGYPGVPYYPGGADSSVIPPGYGDAGGDPFGAGGQIPGDITQVFPGPVPMQQGPVAQGPGQASNIISSDSLPIGADTTDAFGGGDQGFVPAYTPAPQSSMSLPVQSQPSSQSVTSGPTTPTVIVLQQGPGQSPYADAGLPAGVSQDQPSLEPPSAGIEDWARDN